MISGRDVGVKSVRGDKEKKKASKKVFALAASEQCERAMSLVACVVGPLVGEGRSNLPRSRANLLGQYSNSSRPFLASLPCLLGVIGVNWSALWSLTLAALFIDSLNNRIIPV